MIITTVDRRLRHGLKRRTLLRLAVLCCAVSMWAPRQTHAAEPGALFGSERFFAGALQVAYLGGYGIGFRIGSKENRRISRELKFVRPVEFVPRLGIGVTDALGGDAWYRGNVEVLFEGALLFNTEPHYGTASGVGTTLRYNFLKGLRLVPYLDANFGVIGLDFDLKRQADGFNFNVGFGAGSHWFISDRMAVTTDVRWQHISNAETKQINGGINTILMLLGFTYFID
jgi:hypothetical protein